MLRDLGRSLRPFTSQSLRLYRNTMAFKSQSSRNGMTPNSKREVRQERQLKWIRLGRILSRMDKS